MCPDVQANGRQAPQQYHHQVHRVTTEFFATPPASLGDFTAAPFFATDFLKAFSPGFEATQTSVEPQLLITDPIVSDLIHVAVLAHTGSKILFFFCILKPPLKHNNK